MTQPIGFYTPRTPAQPIYYRQGVIKAWNPDTAENTVTVDGTDFFNLPILNGVESLLLAPGAVVGVIDIGTTWAILGRMTIPGTFDAASALDIITATQETINAGENTTSTTPTDLTTIGPTVTITIGRSGRAEVTLTARIATIGADGAWMGYSIDGAGIDFHKVIGVSHGTLQNLVAQCSGQFLETGLSPGDHTFQAKYFTTSGTAAGLFGTYRNISVKAL